jgi:hypothetical protein
VHRNAFDITVDKVNLTGMQSGSDRQTELTDVFGNRESASDCAGRSVKRREEPVAGALDFGAAKSL